MDRRPITAGVVVCATISILVSSGKAAITDGLVGYWSLDGNYLDGSGNGHNGTTPVVGSPNLNSPTFVSGEFGSAVKFDGASDYVRVPDATGLNFGTSTNFTISFWAVLGAINSGDVYYGIISKKLTRSGARAGYMVTVDNDKLIFDISDGTHTASVTSAINVDDNVLRQYTVTVNRSGTAQIYINGIASGSAVNVSGIGNLDAAPPDNQNLVFGSLSGAISNWMTGTLDDVGIWNRVLTAGEIASLQNSSIVPEPAAVSLLALGGLGVILRGRRR